MLSVLVGTKPYTLTVYPKKIDLQENNWEIITATVSGTPGPLSGVTVHWQAGNYLGGVARLKPGWDSGSEITDSSGSATALVWADDPDGDTDPVDFGIWFWIGDGTDPGTKVIVRGRID